jgi:hypothetical protein
MPGFHVVTLSMSHPLPFSAIPVHKVALYLRWRVENGLPRPGAVIDGSIVAVSTHTHRYSDYEVYWRAQDYKDPHVDGPYWLLGSMQEFLMKVYHIRMDIDAWMRRYCSRSLQWLAIGSQPWATMDGLEFASTIAIDGQFSIGYWFSDAVYGGVALFYATSSLLARMPTTYLHINFGNIQNCLHWYDARFFGIRYTRQMTSDDFQRAILISRL